MRSVRKSKIPTDPREPGDKKTRLPLLKRLLARVRAEYKIRKNRRWVQKAVEFVPSKILGWLKCVRAAFNLKFERTLESEPVVQGGLTLSGSERGWKQYDGKFPDPPFPFWWVWSRVLPDDNVQLYRGTTSLDLLGARSAHLLGLRAHNGVEHGPEPAHAIRWTRPEALNGPHVDFEYVEEHPDSMMESGWRKKKFTWDLPTDTQARTGGRLREQLAPFSAGDSREFNAVLPRNTEHFESNPGFVGYNYGGRGSLINAVFLLM